MNTLKKLTLILSATFTIGLSSTAKSQDTTCIATPVVRRMISDIEVGKVNELIIQRLNDRLRLKDSSIAKRDTLIVRYDKQLAQQTIDLNIAMYEVQNKELAIKYRGKMILSLCILTGLQLIALTFK